MCKFRKNEDNLNGEGTEPKGEMSRKEILATTVMFWAVMLLLVFTFEAVLTP